MLHFGKVDWTPGIVARVQQLWWSACGRILCCLSGRLMGIWVSATKWAQQAHERVRRGIAAHPRRLSVLVLAPLAIVILFACVQTALAAVQLNFFNVIAFPSSVTLEWSTASEVNLAGFDTPAADERATREGVGRSA